LYPGHPGGQEESDAILRWANALSTTGYHVVHQYINKHSHAPQWVKVTRNY